MRNKIFLILGVLVLLLSVFIILKVKKEDVIVEAPVSSVDWSAEKFSRLSFFNGSEYRVSINMPEAWEGQYRLKQEGDMAVFYYLDNEAKASKMFSIRQSEDFAGDRVICENNKYRYFLEEYDFENDFLDFEFGLKKIYKSINCD